MRYKARLIPVQLVETPAAAPANGVQPSPASATPLRRGGRCRLLACGLAVAGLLALPATAMGSTALADALPTQGNAADTASAVEPVAQLEQALESASQPVAGATENAPAESEPVAEAVATAPVETAAPAGEPVVDAEQPIVEVVKPAAEAGAETVASAAEQVVAAAEPVAKETKPAVAVVVQAAEPVVMEVSPAVEQAVAAAEVAAERTRPLAEQAAPVVVAVNGPLKTAMEPIPSFFAPALELTGPLLTPLTAPVLTAIAPLTGPLTGPISGLLSAFATTPFASSDQLTPLSDASQVGYVSHVGLVLSSAPAGSTDLTLGPIDAGVEAPASPARAADLASLLLVSSALETASVTRLAGTALVSPAPARVHTGPGLDPAFFAPGTAATPAASSGLSPPHRLAGAGESPTVLTLALAALLALAIPWSRGRRRLCASELRPPHLAFLLERPG